jgi:hypothetical protein
MVAPEADPMIRNSSWSAILVAALSLAAPARADERAHCKGWPHCQDDVKADAKGANPGTDSASDRGRSEASASGGGSHGGHGEGHAGHGKR